MARDVWQFLDFHQLCDFLCKMYIRTLCNSSLCANNVLTKRQKKERMGEKKKSRMAESLETDRVNLIKFYDQIPQQVWCLKSVPNNRFLVGVWFFGKDVKDTKAKFVYLYYFFLAKNWISIKLMLSTKSNQIWIDLLLF